MPLKVADLRFRRSRNLRRGRPSFPHKCRGNNANRRRKTKNASGRRSTRNLYSCHLTAIMGLLSCVPVPTDDGFFPHCNGKTMVPGSGVGRLFARWSRKIIKARTHTEAYLLLRVFHHTSHRRPALASTAATFALYFLTCPAAQPPHRPSCQNLLFLFPMLGNPKNDAADATIAAPILCAYTRR